MFSHKDSSHLIFQSKTLALTSLSCFGKVPRLKWRRYLPLQRATLGIESYILVESDAGYVWDLLNCPAKKTKYHFEIETCV